MVATPAHSQNLKLSRPAINSVNLTKNRPAFSGELPSYPLFGTDGIRGRVGEVLNAPLALQVGFWAGQILRQQQDYLGPVILGQDTRISGNMLGMALSSGLTAAGLEVWNLGICPTPGVAYLTQACGAMGGVMISASHNPPEDNGIKFFSGDGTKLSSDLQKQIESALRGAEAFPVYSDSCGQHYHRPELIKNYADSLYRPLLPTTNLQGMRVVLDLAWGAAVNLAPQVFREMGAEVICLHDSPDGHQINVNCGSTHLDQLRKAVLNNEADLGFAFDGDADRVLAVDSNGRTVDGDYILYFWGQTLRNAQQLPQDLIISTVMANLGFERAWQKLGGKMIRTPVGDQHVHSEMRRTGSMLGGEQSGHILCHHYSVSGDGLLTALHLATLVKQSQKSLNQLVDESFHTYPQRLQNVRVENADSRRHWKNCEPLQKAIATAEADMGDQGRVLVRASGTEPLIRVMVEAANPNLVQYWCDRLVGVVEQYLIA